MGLAAVVDVVGNQGACMTVPRPSGMDVALIQHLCGTSMHTWHLSSAYVASRLW